MKQKIIILFAVAFLVGTLAVWPSVLKAQSQVIENWKINPEKELNPNTKWLREAKWGLFTHYLVHMPSAGVPKNMTAELWNKKVNSFQVKKFGKQLSMLKVPYFFITIGQGGGYYCTPNSTYEQLFGSSKGKLSKRDLVAELAAELVPRGIKMCVYLPSVGREDSPEKQQMWREVITEWSKRWGKAISAWWIDGVYQRPEIFKAYTNAFKAGNPDALVAYNPGPVSNKRDQILPCTEYEDYLAGECDHFLPICGISIFKGEKYYQGPNISGDQLHFLNYLGAWWGTGEPRFPDELVIGWTRNINEHGGSVTWDLPLSDSGVISENYLKQLITLSKNINKYKRLDRPSF